MVNVHLPSPVELAIGADKAVARVVDDEELVGTRVLEKRRHLHAELYARVAHGGDLPCLGTISIVYLEDLLQTPNVFACGRVILPAQEEHRDFRVA